MDDSLSSAAAALGRSGGKATMKAHGRAHYSSAGKAGAATRAGLMEDGRRYRELAALGLLPSPERIERARAKVRR